MASTETPARRAVTPAPATTTPLLITYRITGLHSDDDADAAEVAIGTTGTMLAADRWLEAGEVTVLVTTRPDTFELAAALEVRGLHLEAVVAERTAIAPTSGCPYRNA